MQIQEGARRREELARQRKMNAKMWNLASASDGTLGVPAGNCMQSNICEAIRKKHQQWNEILVCVLQVVCEDLGY